MTRTTAASPRLVHASPEDPALRRLHQEMTGLGHILPARQAPPKPQAARAEADFSDAEDLFDNCPV